MASAYPYITSAEQAAYGLSAATAGNIDAASRIVDNFLGRPEGVVVCPDANGFPAYMGNDLPSMTLKLQAPIQPGANVFLTFPGGKFGAQYIGNVVVLDRPVPGDDGVIPTSNNVESCAIVGVSGSSITLQNVQFAHNAQATVDFGLVIEDELILQPGRSTVMLTRAPIANILSGFGRYSYGRRGDQYSGLDVQLNLLAYTAAFGGPPIWAQFDIGQTDTNNATAQVWVPPGLLLAYFSEVRIDYVAGFAPNAIPQAIKQAVANIVGAFLASESLGGSIKMLKSGNATIERFSASLIDDDTASLLSSYGARRMV